MTAKRTTILTQGLHVEEAIHRAAHRAVLRGPSQRSLAALALLLDALHRTGRAYELRGTARAHQVGAAAGFLFRALEVMACEVESSHGVQP